ncbi:MAG TPA: hypothetical protein PLW93_04410 [Candidatus Absconditabacterales bacterium]|nr:hypothetical protein [Candidatus Absconditabacterales bacterium]
MSLYNNLIKQYGKKKADSVYSAMESEGNKSTKKSAIRKSKKDHPEFYVEKGKKKIYFLKKENEKNNKPVSNAR